MDSKIGHFRVAVSPSGGHQLTEEGSLGGETAQVKAQSCEEDEGTSQAGAKVLIMLGLEKQPDMSRTGMPGPSFSSLQFLWHMVAFKDSSRLSGYQGRRVGVTRTCFYPVTETPNP